ncbi:MAG: heat-inducible transcriptional repressor HrcA [Thermodesulfobacteriota bacterium]
MERNEQILYAIVNNYILTALPVSSKVITKRYRINLCPASVRNIMADLEEKGYLTQPHKSAGRIPTDKGLRFYVDGMLKLKKLNKSERDDIKQRYKCPLEMKGVMERTSKVLSLLSQYMGIVLAPRINNIAIRHIKFIRLRPGYILVVLISASGMVYNKIVNIEDNLSQTDLDRMSAYLNRIASKLPFAQIKAKVLEEIKKEKVFYDRLFSKALEIGHKAMKETEDKGDIYIDGRLNMLEQFGADNIEIMKDLFKAFEEKGILVKILDRSLKAQGVQAFIGTENEFSEVKSCSIVVAPYGLGGCSMGTLGVLGPKNMNYAKVIPLVSYTAKLVGELLTKEGVVY